VVCKDDRTGYFIMALKLLISSTMILLWVACSNVEDEPAKDSSTNVVKAIGYKVPKKLVKNPEVNLLDPKKLKKTPVRKPEAKIISLNARPLGKYKQKPAGTSIVSTPGRDTFKLPEPILAISKKLPVKHPSPVAAMHLWMKDQTANNLQYLDVDHGMNCSFIFSALKDSRGNIWFGTDGGGVTRYDGNSFMHYTKENGICGKVIYSILEDKDGNLWFGSLDNGVTKYDGNFFTNFSDTGGLGGKSVKAILQDQKGNIWMAVYGFGLTKYNGKEFTQFTPKEGFTARNPTSLLEDREGNIWIGTEDKGVYKYDGDSFYNFSVEQGLSHYCIMSMLLDQSGNFWFGTGGCGVNKFDGKFFYHYNDTTGLNSNFITCIYQDRRNNIWFGSYGGGVCKFDGNNFTCYSETDGLSNNRIMATLQDDSGNLWFGTYGGGVTRYGGTLFSYFTERQGLSSNLARSITEDSLGTLWFATFGGGISAYTGSAVANYASKEGLSQIELSSVLKDKKGNLWFGTYGSGAIKFDGNFFTAYSKENGFFGSNVNSITEDNKDNIWFTTEKGVCKYDGKRFTKYSKDQGLCSNKVSKVLVDRSGNVWFGTNKGLTVFDGADFTQFTEKQGFSSYEVLTLCSDSKNNIWIGTFGGGLIKYDGRYFTNYTENEGLSHNIIWSAVEDRNHNMWFGTEKGLSCLLANDDFSYEQRSGDTAVPARFITYHKEDGLKSEDFLRNSVFIDSKNQIWWGGGKGITKVNLNDFKLNNKAPEVRLNNLLLQEKFVYYNKLQNEKDSVKTHNNFYQQINFSKVAPFYNYPIDLELPYHINNLTFYFSAIDWFAPHQVKYQYQLVGADRDWSILNTANKADYRNLQPGSYTLRVKAVGGSGIWSNTFEYSFVIHPPWWKTWWAFCLYGIMAILAVIFIVWRYSRLLRARASLLKRKVLEATNEIKEQKNLIEEKHKEIRDSINYAERIQRSLLASEEQLLANFKEHFIFFRPKDVVSGDFYWATTLSNGNFVLVTADSTGHGVPGAIMSILNISCLEKAVENGKLTTPSEILNYTRARIIATLKRDGSPEGGKDGMDCSILCFNHQTKVVSWASANSQVWVIRRRSEEIEAPVLMDMKGDKMPVGKHEKDTIPFTERSFQLLPGDAIYTFTDGFTDQFGGDNGKKFMKKRLQNVLLKLAHEPMNIQLQSIVLEFKTWKGKIEQVDDVTVIGVRV